MSDVSINNTSNYITDLSTRSNVSIYVRRLTYLLTISNVLSTISDVSIYDI